MFICIPEKDCIVCNEEKKIVKERERGRERERERERVRELERESRLRTTIITQIEPHLAYGIASKWIIVQLYPTVHLEWGG